MNAEKPRVAIITAGDGGSTTEAFVHASQAGYVDAVVSDIIYNNPPQVDNHGNHIGARIERLNCQYAEYGLNSGVKIRAHLINNKTHPRGPAASNSLITDEASDAMSQVLTDADVALGMLFGYRKQIRGSMQTQWANRGLLTNNHPGRVDVAELRGLWGDAVHERSLELAQAGRIDHTGLTVQLVDPKYDLGRPLETVPVPIGRTDTVAHLREAVQATERMHTPRIIGEYLLQMSQPRLNKR